MSLLFNYMQCQSHADMSFIYAQLQRLQLAMTRGSNHASVAICGTKRHSCTTFRCNMCAGGASDGSTQQVAAKAQNTIDGQLNFPDPEHGPKPQLLVQQFQQKVDVSALAARRICLASRRVWQLSLCVATRCLKRPTHILACK